MVFHCGPSASQIQSAYINYHVDMVKELTHQVKREVLKEASSPPLNPMEGTDLVCIKATICAEDWPMSTFSAPNFPILSTPHTDP